MKVLYMVNVPAPYMVSYFNELGKYCDLTVIFEKATSEERDKSWRHYSFTNFNGIILNGISTAVDMAFCPQIIKYLKKNKYDYIICSTMATPTGIIAIEYMKLRRIPFYLESEGGFAKEGWNFKERFKKFLMSGAQGYFSTTEVGDQYFIKYGAKAEKIHKYPFTSLYEKDVLKQCLTPEEKEKVKEALGIKERKMILSVGQFIHRKGFDLLIKAAKEIDSEIGVYIVGGNPTEEYLQLKKKYDLKNVHFEGFKSKEELTHYFKAADVFVLPTREDTWGLVINEAMAYGLPVITTNMCVAGLELVDSENGKLIKADSVEELHESIKEVFEKDLMKLGNKSLERIAWYTFESMADVHMKFFKRGVL